MPVGQIAERLGDVNASLRGAQRHVCEQLDETVIGIVLAGLRQLAESGVDLLDPTSR